MPNLRWNRIDENYLCLNISRVDQDSIADRYIIDGMEIKYHDNPGL